MLKSLQKKIYGLNLSSQVTNQSVYRNRRHLLKLGLSSLALTNIPGSMAKEKNSGEFRFKTLKNIDHAKSQYVLKPLTDYSDITSYNNFYEFGTRKSDPSKYAPQYLKVDPWSIKISGLVKNKIKIDLDKLRKISPIQERVYRLRCVEGWSMVIPWLGYSLEKILEVAQPLGSAKFVEFVTLSDPNQMPAVGGFNPILNWPYREALRIDEAYNPLTLLTFGLYGKELPPQNGAPLRVIVPWKYGFKSPKSIVEIRFLEKMPLTSWVESAPNEYGFFSNVNPNVPHRRWSQKTERRIGEGGLFTKRHKTLIYNGYADEVSNMYTGMDLKRFF